MAVQFPKLVELRENDQGTPWHHGSFAVLLVFLLASATVTAGGRNSTFGVSVRVVTPHQPALAQALPLPSPGHLMQEDVRGRHYFFDGAIADARDHYDAEMRRRGYTLRSTTNDDAYRTEMHWERPGQVALVQMHAALGLAPTRITLRVMMAE